MFFEYDSAEDDWMTYWCDSCGYEEEEQIYMGNYPCPECKDGTMGNSSVFGQHPGGRGGDAARPQRNRGTSKSNWELVLALLAVMGLLFASNVKQQDQHHEIRKSPRAAEIEAETEQRWREYQEMYGDKISPYTR